MKFKQTEIGKIPVHWRVVSIKEIGKVVGGGTPSTKKKEYFGGSIPWITPKDLSGYNRKRIQRGERNITELGLKNSSAKLLPKNTVLLSSRAPIGYVAIADNPLTTNQGFRSIICDESKIIPDYLYYYLKMSKYSLENLASGSTFKEISGKVVEEFKIPLPPLEEQRRITRILSLLDSKIELNETIIGNIEQLAQTLFKRWFIDFEFPNEHGEPYRSSGGKMVESELEMIPEGWEIVKLGTIIEITSGKRPKRRTDKKKIPIIGASKIMGYVEEPLYDEKIIVTGRVGTHGIINRVSYPSWPSDNTLVIKSKFYETVYHYLKLIDFTALNRGSTQPLITQKDIKEIKILLPKDKDLIQKFEIYSEKLFELVTQKEQENEKLTDLRDTLLPKLLSGEIELPDEDEVTEDVMVR